MNKSTVKKEERRAILAIVVEKQCAQFRIVREDVIHPPCALRQSFFELMAEYKRKWKTKF